MHQRTRQAELLFHPAGQLAGQPFGKGGKPGHVEQFEVAFCTLGYGHALQVGVKVEIFLHCQVFIQTKTLRHVADGALDFQGAGSGVLAEHGDASGIRHQQACGKPHERCLAGAVGADEASNHPATYAKTDAAQRFGRALA